MNQDEFTLRLARSTRVSPAEAADQLDGVVHEIVKNLRKGKPAKLPGLGKLTPDQQNKIRFTGPVTRSRGKK